MKNIVLIFMIALTSFNTAFSQPQTSGDSKIEAKIIALEQAGWEAWKNKDASWLKANTTEEFLSINAEGITTKPEAMKSIPKDCDVKSFSLDHFTFVMLNKKTALLTYIAMEDGICDGEIIPASVRVTVTYVKRHGNWMEACYMEATTGQ